MKRVRESKENSVTFKKRKLSNFKLILVPVTHDDYSIDVLKEKLRRVQERSDAEFAKLNALEREIKRMRRIISKRNKIAILESQWKYVYVQIDHTSTVCTLRDPFSDFELSHCCPKWCFLCRIRLFPALISNRKWFGSGIPLMLYFCLNYAWTDFN